MKKLMYKNELVCTTCIMTYHTVNRATFNVIKKTIQTSDGLITSVKTTWRKPFKNKNSRSRCVHTKYQDKAP